MIKHSHYRLTMSIMAVLHVMNRGVDKRNIFLDQQDYLRFIHDLFQFNNTEKASNTGYRHHTHSNIDIVSRYNAPRTKIVDIFAFCLMPNHYHLLIQEKEHNMLSLFMKKLGIGYAKYFNQKYERTGTLFEGRYKSIPIVKESHFIHLPYYIHCNPLDLKQPSWRTGQIENHREAIGFLDTYRWSSHLDYAGKKNFPSVTQRDFLLELFGGNRSYTESISSWLKKMELHTIQDVLIED